MEGPDIPGRAAPANPSRAEDLLALARLSARAQPVRGVLDWLARRTGAPVALVGADGGVRGAAAPDAQTPPPAVVTAAQAAVLELQRRGAGSGIIGGPPVGAGPRAVHVVSVGGPVGQPEAEQPVAAAPGPYLVVPLDPGVQLGTVLSDAARTLTVCWRLEEAERDRDRLRSAEEHSREAVLHLLMGGDVPAARRIASALPPDLPDPARVYVMECAAGRRREAAERLDQLAAGRAWLVPCPVRPNHLIALVPVEDRLDGLVAESMPGHRVGVSEQLPLRETATGYEQAHHALALARPAFRYSPAADPVPPVGPEGAVWARLLLAPCLDHVPPRRADPGAPELTATLDSWLSFGGAAHRHLKIHRNTLAARLRLVESLLGLRLTASLADQTAAWLALRLHLRARPPLSAEAARSLAERSPAVAGPEGLEALLDAPGTDGWARERLRALYDDEQLLRTVRTWLLSEGRLPVAAEALGLSVPGARKRLVRAEEVLGRSLLRVPSTRYELWLAMRACGEL